MQTVKGLVVGRGCGERGMNRQKTDFQGSETILYMTMSLYTCQNP